MPQANRAFIGKLIVGLILVALFLATYSLPATALTPRTHLAPSDINLMGYWPLDDGSGTTVTDYSGNGNDGMLTGGTWTTDHAPTSAANPGALSFTGIPGEGVVTGWPATYATDNVSLLAWVKWAGANGAGQIIVYNGDTSASGYGFYIGPEGLLYILNGGVALASTNTYLPVDSWAQVALIRNTGVWEFYLNGAPLPVYGNMSPNPVWGATGIGRNPIYDMEAFNGLIDDVQIYDRALTSAEIAAMNRSFSITPDQLDFGTQATNAGPTAPQAITLANTSSADLAISSLTLTDPDADQFAIASDTGQTILTSGQARTLELTFDPGTTGAKSATLHIVTDLGTRDVALRGTGLGPAELTVTPATVDFGNQGVPLGATASRAISLSNTGGQDLTNIAVSLTGTDPSQFAIAADTGQTTLVAGALRVVQVTFDPSSLGAKAATLHIASDSGTADVTLGGTGIGVSELSVSPASLAFGMQRLSAGPTFAYSVDIRNTGQADLHITSIGLTGTDAGQFVMSSDTAQTTLIASATRTVRVAFDPSTIGAKTAVVHIVTDNGSRDVTLNGAGSGGLITHLQFDEAANATTFADASDSGHDGTCSTCPTAGTMAGVTGTSLRLGGTQSVSLADQSDLDVTRFSVGTWVYPTGFNASGTPQTVIAKEGSDGANRNFGLILKPNPLSKDEAVVNFSFKAGNCSTLRSYDGVDTINLNEWAHLMMTYDGGYFKLYINGQLDRAVYVTDGACLNSSPVTIGNGAGGYQGMLDEVRIYDYALPAGDVAEVSDEQPIPMKCSRATAILVQYDAPIPFSSSTRTEAVIELRNPTLSNVSSEGCTLNGDLRIFTYGNDVSNIAITGKVDKDDQFSSTFIGAFNLNLAGFTLKTAARSSAITTDADGSTQLRIYNGVLQAPQAVGGLSVMLFKPVTIDSEDGFVVDGTIGLPEIAFGAKDMSGAAADAMKINVSALSAGFIVKNGRLILKGNGALGLPSISKIKSLECGINVAIEFYVDLTGTARMDIDTPVARAAPLPNASVWPVGLSDATFGMSCAPGIPIPLPGPAVAASPIWLTGIRGSLALSQENVSIGAGVTLATSSYRLGPLVALTVSGDMKVGFKPMTIYSGSIPEAYIEVGGDLVILDFWKAVAAKVSMNSVEGFKAWGQLSAGVASANLTLHLWADRASTPMAQKVHLTGSGQLALGVNQGALANICGIPYPCNCYWHKARWPWWWWWEYYYYWCDNWCTDCISIPPRNLWLYGVGVEFGDFRRGAATTIGFKGYTDSTVREIRKLINLPAWVEPIFNALHVGFFFDAQTRTVTFIGWDQYKLIDAQLAKQARQLKILANARPLTAAEQALVNDIKFVNDKTLILNASNQVVHGKATGRAVSPNDAITRTQVFTQTDTLFNITADLPFSMSLITPDGREVTPLNYNQPPFSPTLKIAYSTVTTYTLPRPVSSAPRWRFINTAFDAERQGLTVQLDAAPVFTNVNLLDTTDGYTETVTGTHTIGVVLAGQIDPALTLPFTMEDEQAYSVIVMGHNLTDTLIVTDVNAMPTAFNVAQVRLINGAAQAPAAFDVAVDGEAWLEDSTFRAVSDYRVVAAGTHTLEVRSALDHSVLTTRTLALAEGSIYTLFASDWLSGTDYLLDLSSVLDEQYRVSTITQYGVAQAPIGQWQVKLTGDLTETNWVLGVLGQPNGPVLSNVTLDATQLDAAQVSLNVKAEYRPITITYKLKSDALTETVVFTNAENISTSAVVPQLNGAALAEVAISDAAVLNGTQPIVQALDLTGLTSDNYYILIVVEDGVTPAVEAFARPPAGRSVRGERVANRPALPLAAQTSRVNDPMDLLLGVEPLEVDNTATFAGHFAATPITLSLNAAVYQADSSGTPTLADRAPLYIEWTLSDNPDTDDYVVYLDTQPFPADGVLPTTHVITTEHLLGETTGAHIWRAVSPGQTYYVAVAAVDNATGQIDRSSMVPIVVTSGDFGLLNPIAPVRLIDSITTTINLTKTADLFFDITAVPDQAALPVGLSAQSGAALAAELPITLTASSDIAPGLYSVPIVGYSGDVSHTVNVPVQVQRPDLVIAKTLLTPSAKTGQTITYRVTFTNTGTVPAQGVIITDTRFANMTNLVWSGTANVHSTDGQVWTVDDLLPTAGGIITVSGSLPGSSVAGVLPSEVEITASTPEYLRTNNAATAYLALDGQPVVSTIGPFTVGETLHFGDGLCGSVTFASADELPATLTITYTERQPSSSHTGLQRQYRIEPNGGSNFVAQLALCYEDTELPLARVTNEADLHAYRYEGGGVWQQFSTVDAVNNTITADDVRRFGVWGVATSDDAPTAVFVRNLQARSVGVRPLPFLIALIASGLGAIIGWRWRARRSMG